MKNLMLTLSVFGFSQSAFGLGIYPDNVCEQEIELIHPRINESNWNLNLATPSLQCEILQETPDGKGFLVNTKQGYNADIRYVVGSNGKGYRVPNGRLLIEPIPQNRGHYNHGSYTPFGVDMIDDSSFERIEGKWIYVARLSGIAQSGDIRDVEGRTWNQSSISYIGRDLCGNLIDFDEIKASIQSNQDLPGVLHRIHSYLSSFTGIFALSIEDAIQKLQNREPEDCEM